MDTLGAILETEPPELAAIRPEVPRTLDRLVQHCLAKNPALRFQSARDVVFALEGATESRPAVAPPDRARDGKSWVRPAAIVLAAIGVVGAALLAGRSSVRVPVAALHRMTFRRGTVTAARFASDGDTVVYAAAWEGSPFHVFSARTEGPDSRQLDVQPADLLALSPAGELALMLDRHRREPWVSQGTLARAALGGGAARLVLDGVQWADWSQGGDVAVVRDVGGQNRLEFPVGHVIFQTPGYVSNPRFSPSSAAIAFIDHRIRAADEGTIRVAGLDGRVIASSAGWISAWGLAWRSDDEVWFTASPGRRRSIAVRAHERRAGATRDEPRRRHDPRGCRP